MSVEIPAMVKVGDAASFGIRMTRRDVAPPLSSLGIVEMSPQGDREGE